VAPEKAPAQSAQLSLFDWRPPEVVSPPKGFARPPISPRLARVVGTDPATPDELAARDELRAAVRTRADCLPGGINAERPCPLVGCKHHLKLDAQANGTILVAAPNYRGTRGRSMNPRKTLGGPREISRLAELASDLVVEAGETCALDVSDRVSAGAEPPGFEELGTWLATSKERPRQLVAVALEKIKAALEAAATQTEETPNE
jgi:hypothetical protein